MVLTTSIFHIIISMKKGNGKMEQKMTPTKEKELKQFIDFYNDKKETDIAFYEMYNFTGIDAGYEEKIKDNALNQTIGYIEDYYGVHTAAFAASTAASLGVGSLAAAGSVCALNEIVSDAACIGISVGVGIGTAILTEFAIHRQNKKIREYDEKAKCAAEMTQKLREYRREDKNDVILINSTNEGPTR